MHPTSLESRRIGVRRGAAILFLLLALWIVQRVFFVYTVRTGRCTAGSTPLTEVEPAVERPAPPGARNVVVMSWNIEGHAAALHDDHLPAIAAVIREENPDIVGLQEVHRGTWQSRFRDQAEELARLTGLKVYFGPSFEALGGEYGNAVLTRGTIVRGVVHELPSVGEPRSLSQVIVDLDGRRIALFVTHLAAWGSLHRRSRGEQLDCIAAHLEASRLPWVLVGDLNAPPTAAEIGEFTARPGLRRAPDAGLTHPLTRRILDYVFYSPRLELGSLRVVTEGPSDHYALVADIRPADVKESP